MIKTFFEWMTYNPDNISIAEVLPHIITLFLIVFVVVFIGMAVLTRFSFKTFVLSVMSSVYLFFVLFWQLCFYSSSIWVGMMPIYPLLLIYGIVLGIRAYRKNKARTEEAMYGKDN